MILVRSAAAPSSIEEGCCYTWLLLQPIREGVYQSAVEDNSHLNSLSLPMLGISQYTDVATLTARSEASEGESPSPRHIYMFQRVAKRDLVPIEHQLVQYNSSSKGSPPPSSQGLSPICDLTSIQ